MIARHITTVRKVESLRRTHTAKYSGVARTSGGSTESHTLLLNLTIYRVRRYKWRSSYGTIGSITLPLNVHNVGSLVVVDEVFERPVGLCLHSRIFVVAISFFLITAIHCIYPLYLSAHACMYTDKHA